MTRRFHGDEKIKNTENTENFRVVAEVRLLNKYVQRAKKVAISAINPIIMEEGMTGSPVRALNIWVEGPSKHIRYFKRLIDEANLEIR